MLHCLVRFSLFLPKDWNQHVSSSITVFSMMVLVIEKRRSRLKLDQSYIHGWKRVMLITVRSPHLNKRMPVGDRFSRIREHFTPVVSPEVVCIVADSTHANDLIMAYTVGAEGKEVKHDHSQSCIPKIMMYYIMRVKRQKQTEAVKLFV